MDWVNFIIGFGIPIYIVCMLVWYRVARPWLRTQLWYQSMLKRRAEARKQRFLREQLVTPVPGPTLITDVTDQVVRPRERPSLADIDSIDELLPPRRPVPASPLATHVEDWIDELLDAIHLVVIGGTNAGKTTLLHELVRRLLKAQHAVVVCDPDAARGDWAGAEVYGAGDDFQAIERALLKVQAELGRRRGLRAEGARTFDPLWLIVDEYPDVQTECPSAVKVVENLLRRARKVNVHLVLGAQDRQVKSLGFERKGQLLVNTQILTLTYDRSRNARQATFQDGTVRTIPVLHVTTTPKQDTESNPLSAELAVESRIIMPDSAAGEDYDYDSGPSAGDEDTSESKEAVGLADEVIEALALRVKPDGSWMYSQQAIRALAKVDMRRVSAVVKRVRTLEHLESAT